MKIEVKTTRDCCHPREDLMPVEGSPRFRGMAAEFVFCKHCGRMWEAFPFTDPAGGSDWEYRRIKTPWEARKPAVAVDPHVGSTGTPDPRV
jgi:hypothetical protein